MFQTPEDFVKAQTSGPNPDLAAIEQATQRQKSLTKPLGSLGRLEEIAIWLAGWQGVMKPRINKIQTLVFAGNHGITKHGISPFPAEVTEQMVANFKRGGAAINALSNAFDHDLKVHALDLQNPTQDWTTAPAMSIGECLDAINTGASAINDNADLLIFGEMGIGNTTTAAALAAATFGGSGADWVGPGTGHNAEGIAQKAAIVDLGISTHKEALQTCFDILQHLGGRELCAIAGAISAARHKRIPVLLDGYVTTAAAAPLYKTSPDALAHCIAGHQSAEPAHKSLLEKLQLPPLLQLDMRLGEGSGAAVAANIISAAVATHSNMATFEEAGVTDRKDGDSE